MDWRPLASTNIHLATHAVLHIHIHGKLLDDPRRKVCLSLLSLLLLQVQNGMYVLVRAASTLPPAPCLCCTSRSQVRQQGVRGRGNHKNRGEQPEEVRNPEVLTGSDRGPQGGERSSSARGPHEHCSLA